MEGVTMESKADCYQCRFRRSLFEDELSCCLNKAATAMNHAKSMVEDFVNFWPFYYAPSELTSCDGFIQK